MDQKLISKLTKMKDAVDKAETAKSRAEGALNAIMQDIKKTYGIKSLDDLSALIDEKEEELAGLEAKFEKEIQKTESAYPWDTISLQR